jgi:hypothetical protein
VLRTDEQDLFDAASHQRAAAGWEDGLFDDEVVPVEKQDFLGTSRFEDFLTALGIPKGLGALPRPARAARLGRSLHGSRRTADVLPPQGRLRRRGHVHLLCDACHQEVSARHVNPEPGPGMASVLADANA